MTARPPYPEPQAQQEALGDAPTVDLEELGAPKWQDMIDLAWALRETPVEFCGKVGKALRERYATEHGWCPWPSWRIKEALMARMEGK